MAKQTVNPGIAPTGAGGDTFRSAQAKFQENDNEIYAQLGANDEGVLPNALPIGKGGTGATTAANARAALGLGTASQKNTGRNTGDVLLVGDFGVGSQYSPILTENSNATPSCLIDENSAPEGTITTGGIGLKVRNSAIYGIINIRWNGAQIVYVDNGYVRSYELLHKQNTTTDSNGFIKAASPIINLFSDRIKLNEEAKKQPIIFEKLGVGDYIVRGSNGLSQSGWYIETPKDANGNVLFSVIYETLVNGDISVKTYKKKMDLETAMIVADLNNPMDITEGRWIDIRLQELPVSEKSPSESSTPAAFKPTNLTESVAEALKYELEQ